MGTDIIEGSFYPKMMLYKGKLVARIDNQYEDSFVAIRKKYHALKNVDRVSLLAAYCAQNLSISEGTKDLIITIGSSRGATLTQEKSISDFNQTGHVPLLTSPQTTFGNISSAVASVLEKRSFLSDNSVTCSSAIYAVCNAMAWLKSNMAQAAIAGGAEAPISPYTLAQIDALGISQCLESESFPCRPFDYMAEKNSFVLGEGAGLALIELATPNFNDLVIESVGFNFTDPPSMTGIDSDGGSLKKSMRMALDNMQTPDNIDVILAHAPGTIKGDKAEFNAIQEVFGEKPPYVFSSKWMTGHTYAASAMMNLKIASSILNGKQLPPIPFQTYLNQDNEAPKSVYKVMINASGFGGNSMTLIVSKGLLS